MVSPLHLLLGPNNKSIPAKCGANIPFLFKRKNWVTISQELIREGMNVNIYNARPLLLTFLF